MKTYLMMLGNGKFARLVRTSSWSQEETEWEPVNNINEATVMADYQWARWMSKHGKIPATQIRARATRTVEIVVDCE